MSNPGELLEVVTALGARKPENSITDDHKIALSLMNEYSEQAE